MVFSTDKVGVQAQGEVEEKTMKSVKKYSEFFVDLAMQEYDFQMTFRPSVVALACILCARTVSKITP